MLLKTVEAGTLHPGQLITHHFRLADILDADETFSRAAAHDALKVRISA